MKKIFLLLFLALLLVFSVHLVNAENVDCNNVPSLNAEQLGTCIDQLSQAKTQSEKATKPLEEQVTAIQNRVNFIEKDLVIKEKNINEGYKNLEKQYAILNDTIRDYYIKSYYNTPFLLLLTSNSVSELTQVLGYQKATADRDKAIITNIVLLITTLEERKKSLEIEKQNIVVVKEKLDKIVGEAKVYQATLKSRIAQISARQQQILSQRLASLNIPRSAGTSARGCSDDRGVDPGFSPRIAFFTYGAPHRNGLNQYGAKGRADAEQNAEQILQEYYPGFSLKKDYDQNAKVNVDGNGEFTIENYTKHIFEVPETWPMETLKAQAVAARTYALNSMQRNGHICTTEACQVFHPEEKGGRWNEAVAATAGWVLMDGGNPGFSQYASTHGGYILNLGKFDGSGGNPTNFGELNDRAYDKASPWFYCDWGARSQYSNTAWLKSNEVADIVNAIMLARTDSSLGKHLYQTDKPNPEGTDTWDEGKVRQELSNRGITPFNSITGISISADFGSGKTTTVNVSGDGRSTDFPGSEFKDWFNLRAPANIQIVGPLYNVEQK